MSEHQSICKSIYSEEGFNGILTALSNFPERLREEILEDLSMNMFEWESKLLPEEKEDLSDNLKKYTNEKTVQNTETLLSLKEDTEYLISEINRVETNREELLRTIEEFPSINPETDIESIGTINQELETLQTKKCQVDERMKFFSYNETKKSERLNDSLF